MTNQREQGRQAVESIVKEWCSTKAADLLPSAPPKHRAKAAGSTAAAMEVDGAEATAVPSSSSQHEPTMPPANVISDYQFPVSNWTYRIEEVAATMGQPEDRVAFAVTFSQPLRTHPVPAATATLWMTYYPETNNNNNNNTDSNDSNDATANTKNHHGSTGRRLTIRVESQSYAHAYVPHSTVAGKWVRAGSKDGALGSINMLKWCTEIIRAKMMVHEGVYANMYQHVYGTTTPAAATTTSAVVSG